MEPLSAARLTVMSDHLPAATLALMQELGELKRVRSAGRSGSIACRLFEDSWGRLVGGMAVETAMRGNVARSLCAGRLGDLDPTSLQTLGLEPAQVASVMARGFVEVADALHPILQGCLEDLDVAAPPPAPLPAFVTRLAEQPRAGVTCPGRPRLMLEPAETHAEHCQMVAIYGVLLAPHFGADPATVWLAGLAHHLHNALLPDSGYVGEVLLGSHLGGIVERASAHALAQLPEALARQVEDARRFLADADTPEGRAFHAADTLDRVWQIGQHLRVATLSLDVILGEMALVHDGPTKPFQDAVLRAAGIAS